jgi:hypothetical protein
MVELILFYVVANIFMIFFSDNIYRDIKRNGFQVKHLVLFIVLFPATTLVVTSVVLFYVLIKVSKLISKVDMSSRFSRLMNKRLL